MYIQNDAPKTKNKALIYVLVLIAFAVAGLSLTNSFKNFAKEKFFPQNRRVLAKIISRQGLEQKEYFILKLQDSSGLLIEIYENQQPDNRQIYKQSFQLAQDNDAYLTLDKNTTNLALSDVDKDGQMDILAPSVDRNGNLRLNTFKYNHELQLFEVLQETPSP